MLTIQVNPIISDKHDLLKTVKLTHFVSPFANYCQWNRMKPTGKAIMRKKEHDSLTEKIYYIRRHPNNRSRIVISGRLIFI